MDITETTQSTRFRMLWSALSSVKVSLIALVLMLIIWLIGLITTPPPSELGSVRFTTFALLTLFQTPLFLLPVALLLLNSLLAGAEYTLGAWQRWREGVAPIEWQHPFATRGEYIKPLDDEANVSVVSSLNENLRNRAFRLHDTPTPYLLTATYQRWGWWGLPLVYFSLILLVVALLSSYMGLSISYETLLPQQSINQSELGTLQLLEIDAHQAVMQQESNQPINISRYWPLWMNGYVVMPLAFEPIITVIGEDETGTPLRFMPIQENLVPTERLHLLLYSNTPLYFQIPTKQLAFQITPATTGDGYNVQVLVGDETTPSLNETYQAGDVIAVEKIKVIISQNYSLPLLIHRDPLAWLYPLIIAFSLIGILITWLTQPAYLWVLAEHGQLYCIYEQRAVGQQNSFPAWLADVVEATSKEKLEDDVSDDQQNSAVEF